MTPHRQSLIAAPERFAAEPSKTGACPTWSHRSDSDITRLGEPGFVEADLVAHSGPVASGSYIQTLCLTDIASGWTECAPLLVREQKLLCEVLTELRRLLPFKLLGFDTTTACS
ncbi:hypothetical protein MES5069_460014 [Mesorhizobium escarrei]|uniref:Transposase n=1 Tax=Mesorhizobium escarrei TaxID=666018 RepID=A0ABM9E7R6_9HYPH|nr:hypothetical protein MES5069_460014 [Mesorhizobium escarrei]